MTTAKPIKVRSFESGAAAQPPALPAAPTPQHNAVTPYLPQQPYSSYLPAVTEPAKSGSGLLSGFNLGQIKTMIDRMGGIEGVLDTVSKVQKVMQSVQQLAPMIRLLMPKLNKADEDDYIEEDYRPRPRRRRRRRAYGNGGSTQRRRYGYASYKTRRPLRSRRLPPRRRRK